MSFSKWLLSNTLNLCKLPKPSRDETLTANQSTSATTAAITAQKKRRPRQSKRRHSSGDQCHHFHKKVSKHIMCWILPQTGRWDALVINVWILYIYSGRKCFIGFECQIAEYFYHGLCMKGKAMVLRPPCFLTDSYLTNRKEQICLQLK